MRQLCAGELPGLFFALDFSVVVTHIDIDTTAGGQSVNFPIFWVYV